LRRRQRSGTAFVRIKTVERVKMRVKLLDDTRLF